MSSAIRLFDVVALLEDIPALNLLRGQVGTVVEELAPDAFEVEFCDNDGRTLASLGFRTEQLLVLHYNLARTA